MEWRDQMGRLVELNQAPQRVISLVPSITEFLIDLGVKVVGRTKFCVHPQSQVQDIPTIGGTKNFRLEQIDKLQPDLIIGNKEENYQEGIEAVSDKFPVYMTDIQNLSDAEQMMHRLAEICDKQPEGESLISQVKDKWNALKNSRSGRVAYIIWKDPLMAAGSETYIDAFLTHLGYTNAIIKSRYPQIQLQELAELAPDEILLSSEPFPFSQKHIADLQEHLPNIKFRLVNGEFFSWYGTRILKCNEMLEQ